MMEDLAMHILEIMMNSIKAGAKKIILTIKDSFAEDRITMTVEDDGKGMSEEFVQRISDPFTTTRTTRKIGMGVSFMKGLSELCNGHFNVASKLGKGTTVTCDVQKSCIDTPELGDLGEMIMYCIQADASIHYVLEYITDENSFRFDTDEIKNELQEVPLDEPEILLWMKDYVNQNIKHVKEA